MLYRLLIGGSMKVIYSKALLLLYFLLFIFYLYAYISNPDILLLEMSTPMMEFYAAVTTLLLLYVLYVHAFDKFRPKSLILKIIVINIFICAFISAAMTISKDFSLMSYWEIFCCILVYIIVYFPLFLAYKDIRNRCLAKT